MAITVSIDLHPYGYGSPPQSVATMRIHTSECGTKHEYSISMHERFLVGAVPKLRSGHRNPLHLLAQILETISLETLGHDYARPNGFHPGGA